MKEYPLRGRLRTGGAITIGLVLAAAPEAIGQESHLLVVAGLGGEPGYDDAFHQWASAMVQAAETKCGLPAGNVSYLAPRPERAPGRIDGPSTKAGVERSLAELGGRLRPEDTLLVLLIGHGSFQDGQSRFNLPGPDLTAAELARLMDRLPPARVAVVSAFSASGEFVKALSGRGRVVVSATKSGHERNESVFGRYFVEAYAGHGADVDKDSRVSLREAFDYARREVARFYEAENRLLTEHAVLEDGAGAPVAGPGDGARAGRFFLGGATSGRPGAPQDPRVAALRAERQELEARIEALKARKASMEASAYQAELERLLVALAEKDVALRGLAGQEPR